MDRIHDIILKAGELTTPTPASALFDREGPLVLEVGFGGGHYLEHLGLTHPEWNLVGAEVSLGSVWRTYRRMKRNGISEVRLFKGNARFLVRDVFEEHALDRVFVNSLATEEAPQEQTVAGTFLSDSVHPAH